MIPPYSPQRPPRTNIFGPQAGEAPDRPQSPYPEMDEGLASWWSRDASPTAVADAARAEAAREEAARRPEPSWWDRFMGWSIRNAADGTIAFAEAYPETAQGIADAGRSGNAWKAAAASIAAPASMALESARKAPAAAGEFIGDAISNALKGLGKGVGLDKQTLLIGAVILGAVVLSR